MVRSHGYHYRWRETLGSAASAVVMVGESLEARVIECMRGRVPGLSLAVVRSDGIRWLRGFGVADLKTRLPAAPDTVYLSFSMTKIATATAVLDGRRARLVSVPIPAGELPAFVEHLGGGGGFFNVMRLYPEAGLGIVMMGNATGYDYESIVRSIIDRPWD